MYGGSGAGTLFATARGFGRTPPPFPSNLLMRFDDESPMYQDKAGTVLAVANGSPVRAIGDAAGGLLLAQLTSATAGALTTTAYSRRAVTWTSANTTFGVSPYLGQILNKLPNWSIMCLMKPTNAASTMTLFWNSTARTQLQWMSGPLWAAGTLGTTATTAPPNETTVPHTYGISNYAGGFASGSDRTQSYIAGAPVQSGAYISTSSDNTNAWSPLGGGGLYTGDSLAIYVYDRQMYPHEMIQVSDHLYARFGLTNPRAAATKVVVWNANSISVLGQTPTQLPELTRLGLGYPIGSFFTLAQTSKAWSQMVSEGPTVTDPLLLYLKNDAHGPGNPVYVNHEGVNDTTVADLWSDLSARVAAGGVTTAKIVVGNVMARGANEFPTWDTIRTPLNAAIAAQVGVNYGALADVSSDAIMGSSGNPNGMDDPTYSGDGTHPTNAGCARLTPFFQTAIAAV